MKGGRRLGPRSLVVGNDDRRSYTNPRTIQHAHVHTHTAFAPGPGGGPDGKGTGGGGALGVLGKLLTAGAARVAVAGAVASLAVGLQLAPPGSFQLYHTVGEIPAVAFREVRVRRWRVGCVRWRWMGR